MRTVGLLGGSFNPAHEGHRHISVYALKMLGLDEVWWMVSPQNPLKSLKPAPLEKRMADARKVARHPKIKVTDIESQLGTRYTVDTLKKLKQKFPDTRFIFLMGADNLHQFHRWRKWKEIINLVPIAVLDRPPHSLRACPLTMKLPQLTPARLLKKAKLPALSILHIPLNNQSSTALRLSSRTK